MGGGYLICLRSYLLRLLALYNIKHTIKKMQTVNDCQTVYIVFVKKEGVFLLLFFFFFTFFALCRIVVRLRKIHFYAVYTFLSRGIKQKEKLPNVQFSAISIYMYILTMKL